MSTINKRS